MALVASLIVAGTAIAGGVVSARGQRQTNAQNVALSREQMDWSTGEAYKQRDFEKEMSDTAVVRRIEDLKKAGLNPMLAYNGVADTPSYQLPSYDKAKVENPNIAMGQGIASAGQAVLEAQQTKANTQAARAQARKTDAEAQVVESELPYSAKNAQVKSDTLNRQFVKLGHEVHQIMRDEELKDMDIDELKPLVIEYQKLVNQAELLGLSEKAATSEFFKNVPEAKWVQILKTLVFGSGPIRR